MADFCKQCSENTFGEDFRELAGLTTPEDWAEGKAAIVICEGCGPIQVDPDGRCVSTDCLDPSHGGDKRGAGTIALPSIEAPAPK